MISTPLPTAILVHGLPCSGKTTIAREIARYFNLPLFEKDGIKEILFDTLGYGDRQISRQLGMASVELLFYLLRAETASGNSLVIDCNFHPEYDNARLHSIQADQEFHTIQILCWAQGDILFRRFKERTGKRHPGHGDADLIEEIGPVLLTGRAEPLAAVNDTCWVDTGDFTQVEYGKIFRWISTLAPHLKPAVVDINPD